MSRNDAKKYIDKLFDELGLIKSKPGKISSRLDWAERYPENVVKEVISWVIDNEEKLPSIPYLYTLAKKNQNIKAQVKIEDEECFYCGSTGFVPVLIRPNEMSSVPYMRNYSCKCTRGDNKATIEVHGEQKHFTDACFDKFPELQFEHRLHEFPNMNYPQIVDQIKILLA